MSSEETIISAKEFSDLTTFKLSSVYSLVSYKQLPSNIYRKLGRKLVFLKNATMKWVLNGAELKKRPRKEKNNNDEV